MSRSAKVNQLILIIFDDVRAEHLFHWKNEGKLPHIAQLAEKGISSQACVTSFPSVTLPCYSDIITGSNSGYFPKEGSGVPNYHWLDRADPPIERRKHPFIRNYSERKHLLKINKDVGSHAKTIFEQADDGNFLSATSFFYRGSTFTTPTEYRPELILKKMEEVFKNPREVFSNQEIPRISVGYIPHTDSLMHGRGFDHPDYINLVLNCDKFIGSLIKTLRDIGHMEDTAICVTADHGNYKASKFYDLEPFFQSKRLKPYSPSTGNGNFDANLGGVGFFNFKGDTWFHHPSITQMKNYKISNMGDFRINLYEELWDIPGAKLMYYKEDENTADKGTIHLERYNRETGKKQKGRIDYIGTGRNQETKYTFENEDLFGYAKHEKA
ncbi:MAG: alkaline phosphatase family protein, partial [Promethearchaeota archaeon]